jgi:Ca2+-binding EF-hand superfamily protein
MSINSVDNFVVTPHLSKIIVELKSQLSSRGARGFIGLSRKFKIMDDDHSQSIDISEFKKAMRECALELPAQDLQSLFNFFDKDGSGCIDFEEFIQGLQVI